MLLALQLLRRSIETPAEILIIEKSSSLGRGLAYNVPSDRCKLNVPANSMGAFPENPEGFLTWLRATNHQVEPTDFMSRALFGDYLQGTFAQRCAQASGVHVTHIQDEASDIFYDQKNATFEISLAQQSSQVADVCILALGNIARATLSGMPIDTIFSSPYNPKSYSNIHELKELLIIGTSLTAVDCVLEAEGRGFTGRYTMVSRHGYLPLPHEPGTATPSTLITPTIADYSTLPSLSLREITHLIAKESRERGSSQPSITSLRPHLQTIWSHLSVSDKRRFLRHVRPLWEIHRHRIPRPHFDRLQDLIHSKRLYIHAGRLSAAERSDHGITVQVAPSLERSPRSFDAAMLCTGPESDLTKIEMPLIKNLLLRGVIAPGELGLGAHPAKTTLPESGRKRFKFIGPLQRESLWEITAVRELRLEAEKLAKEICELLLVS